MFLICLYKGFSHFCAINIQCMKAKTVIELLTLSTNLYMISKDDEHMKNLSELTKKGKKTG